MDRLTNRELAQTDPVFRAACEKAGVYPSRNQYRKWKYHRGAAYLNSNGISRKALDNHSLNGIKV